ncbi:MAG: phosphoserine transaminase [Neisseriaceae bacterium]|nr:MAG: phosphoserine transaminase [Neisseriaceae bacterium]
MALSEVFNFSAGPATLPREVLLTVQNELLDYRGTGLSVMTVSHRSNTFLDILHQAESDLSQLLGVPDDYAILFLQGGASLRFTDIVCNLSLSQKRQLGCVVSGNWSKIAYQQMSKIKLVSTKLIANSEQDGYYVDVPLQKDWLVNLPLDFIHFTSNETVHGVQYQTLPHRINVDYPLLVCDMSSDFLSRRIKVRDYALIYAGAQKNIGPSGVTVVIVQKDLLSRAPDTIPDVLNYQSHFNKNGMYNTPNTFGTYVCGLVMKWLLQRGGLSKMEEINTEKAKLLYSTIDESNGFYSNHVCKSARSKMNVVFYTPNEQLDALFIEEATKNNLKFLKGYKSMGGMRASIYNAMPLKGVQLLSEFMQDFQRRYG